MADIIFWVLFGILTGWIATLTTEHGPHRIKVNIGIAVLGAIAGVTLAHAFLSFTEQGINFSVPSLLAAVCGAIVLLTVVRTVDRER